MKQMIYGKKMKRELLCEDTYLGFKYYILNLGTHPTAYVEIPKVHKYFGKDYDDIDIDVHGGLTYSDDYLYISEDKKIKNSWFLGWDYAHAYDYCGFYPLDTDFLNEHTKKWTTEEMIEDCKSVIKQLSKE